MEWAKNSLKIIEATREERLRNKPPEISGGDAQKEPEAN